MQVLLMRKVRPSPVGGRGGGETQRGSQVR